MKSNVLMSLTVLALLGACATKPESRIADLPGGKNVRSTASAPENLFWFAHPCGDVKGAPYRKYHSFALDEVSGVIYARTSEAAQPQEIKDKPNGKVAWDSVTEFLEAKGIKAFCDANAASVDPNGQAVTPPAKPPGGEPSRPSKPSRPAKPPRLNDGDDNASHGDFRPPQGGFIAPVNMDAALYYQSIQNVSVDVKKELYRFLASPHLQAVGEADEVVASCPAPTTNPEAKRCVRQKQHDYKQARVMMFGDVDLRKADGGYEVFDFYCQKWMGNADFTSVGATDRDLPGPGNIVHSKKMNAEHTWPQSKFPDPKGSALNLMEKTDLHHIFSTDTKVNGIRGNFDFAEVEATGAKPMWCADGRLGKPKLVEGLTGDATSYFEPPQAHKGNVARALFYFATRYNAGMSSLQEYYLRKWNREDPVDDQERARNESIYRQMGVRNPFVDDSSFADRIPRFCRLKMTADQAEGKNDCP